ncbi:MAG TPA: TetR/AcrR family transcriptional regulator [Sporichthyaceae bacterium]|nr:TetR/AcrR family transcriptional regulator [Sporichthyaceae bacterium]
MAYELRARAESMAATRQRITEATVDLHGSVGPARTTVAAIAEAAGVQRHTVYRHFPTDAELFAACAEHYWARHPWPDPAQWTVIADPLERVRAALTAMYEFYGDIEPMLANVLRDAAAMDVVDRNAQVYREFIGELARSLAAAVAPKRSLARAAVQHALEFPTWQSLVGQDGISSPTAVRLMVAFVEVSSSI